ncbi:MAG: hypothetical protein HKN79_10320 [Flavobacteriales bacterium]|nr:hypothetical protein [Flavobacteriales bacterium]
MRTHLLSFILLIGLGINGFAQDKTTIEAVNTDISDNLDLEAVASLFAEAKDLEDFEQQLNDPESRYSNLDLNQDGYVDYLRVLEKKKGNVHSITIQAVIGKDSYQDVAYIDVEKDKSGDTRVQIVGDVYMYGPDYIIEPVYVRPPVIYTWFWGPRWSVWHSPWYWGYYPSYWSVWRPYPWHVYHAHIRPMVHVHHHYHYVPYRRSAVCKELSRDVSRKDLAKDRPERAFAQRHDGVKNKYELDNKRGTQTLAKPRPAKDVKTTGKEIRSDWKPSTTRDVKPTQNQSGREVAPADRNTGTGTKVSRTDEAKPRSTPEVRESKPSSNTSTREAKPRTSSESTRSTRTEKPQRVTQPSKPSTPSQPRTSTRSSSSSKPSSTTRSTTRSSSPSKSSSKSTNSSSKSRGDR